MFGIKPNQTKVKFDAVKNQILDEMLEHNPDDPEYATLVDHLDKVNSMSHEKRPRVDPNQIIQTVGVFLTVGLIAAYEQKHVWTSKGLAIATKTK